MRILADENLYVPIIEHLRSLSHDVLDARAAGLLAASDDKVYRRAVREKRIIVTMDKDFLRRKRYPPKRCGGSSS